MPDISDAELTEDTNSRPIFETVKRFLEEDGWTYSVDSESQARFSYRGDNGNWTCVAHVREANRQLVFYSILPDNVPENKRGIAAEFITRANFGIILGNFEMDFEDGEIRYKTSMDVADGVMTPNMVKGVVLYNMLTMDRYVGALRKSVYGDIPPMQTILEVERETGEGDGEA